MVEVFILACLKCGATLADGQSFCENCRRDMAQYPVKPDTVVHIIPRPAEPEEKKHAGKEERAKKEPHAYLRSTIRWLTVTVGIMTIVICALAAILLETLQAPEEPNTIGKNYTVIESDR